MAIQSIHSHWRAARTPFITTNQREGREMELNFEKMLRIVTGHGYRGYIGIEYEGHKQSPDEGVLETKRVMEAIRRNLS